MRRSVPFKSKPIYTSVINPTFKAWSPGIGEYKLDETRHFSQSFVQNFGAQVKGDRVVPLGRGITKGEVAALPIGISVIDSVTSGTSPKNRRAKRKPNGYERKKKRLRRLRAKAIRIHRAQGK